MGAEIKTTPSAALVTQAIRAELDGQAQFPSLPDGRTSAMSEIIIAQLSAAEADRMERRTSRLRTGSGVVEISEADIANGARTLGPGCDGVLTLDYQQRLDRLGYTSKCDGKYDTRPVEAFQRDGGLCHEGLRYGVIDRATRNSILTCETAAQQVIQARDNRRQELGVIDFRRADNLQISSV